MHEFIDISDDIIDANNKQEKKKHLYPPKKSGYLNEPYTFESVQQINQLIDDVKTHETADTYSLKSNDNGKDMIASQTVT